MPPPLTFSVRKLLRGHLGLPAACVCVCVLVMLRGHKPIKQQQVGVRSASSGLKFDQTFSSVRTLSPEFQSGRHMTVRGL